MVKRAIRPDPLYFFNWLHLSAGERSHVACPRFDRYQMLPNMSIILIDRESVDYKATLRSYYANATSTKRQLVKQVYSLYIAGTAFRSEDTSTYRNATTRESSESIYGRDPLTKANSFD